jgi:hypothetical protein
MIFEDLGFFFKVVKTRIPKKEVGTHEKNLKLKVSVLEKKIGSENDTEIGPWFQFPIPKPGFGHTLPSYYLNVCGLRIQKKYTSGEFIFCSDTVW